ncbi:cell division protein ZapA [Sphingomonas baiyangensis]|uniref:Cell division protein ZapA n=1 Tax=Sphingomonas baiyangensis TaxID=2572576 RepID=A0A4U1L4D2_9SPHN|nr:cell division protein ZapA [Sphingomonas baiyangensis]TKD51063.1 cell division protein ZapA [Sphingomonas baiyangensis]
MGEVSISIAGRVHKVQCRDGEEAHLERLGARLAAHGEAATRASGGMSAERTMLFIALMLADDLVETEARPAEAVPAMLLDRVADRLEAVAAALEEAPANA